MTKIYYIGGSPCSGKSTVAEIIASKFNLQYFKVDDFLDDYIAKGKEKGKPFSTKSINMTVDESWLRSPIEQNEEELEIYREMFEFVINDLRKIDSPKDILAEGAAFLPELMNCIGVNRNHYICIVPTKEFQYFHYKQRPFVPYVLEGCSNKEQAFENWMERDAIFAETVKQSAEKLGYRTIVTDGKKDINYTYRQVCKAFGLEL